MGVFRHKTIGRGYVENIRFELLFAVNNCGPNFNDDGVYVGSESDEEEYMNELSQKVVTEFDRRITDIEKTANKVLAMQWLPREDEPVLTQSCLQDSSSVLTCSDMGMGDANLRLCELCEVRDDILRLHELAVKTTGDHVDPRLNAKAICWPHFGNRLKWIFKQLKNKVIAGKVDWKKISHITRAFMMHNLSITLTEVMLKTADEEAFGYIDFVPELMARNRYDPLNNVSDAKDISNMVDELLNHLVPENYADELQMFNNMTLVEGLRFRRNEREDHRYFGLDYECDEYIGLHDTHRTPYTGETYGRFVAGRKRVLFNPLNSGFIEQIIHETTDRDFQRLANMGVTVGQTIDFPTRRIRSQRRCMYWDILEGWPACDHTEGREVNHTETRYKCSIPAPMCLINQADLVTIMNEIGSPIELI